MPDHRLSVIDDDRRCESRAAFVLADMLEGEVRFTRHDRLLYATDASIYQVEPIGVVVPASIADAEMAVRYCAGVGLPVLARGGGTALAGQTVNRAVVLDFSARCDAIVSLDAATRRAVVEPGVVLDRLNAAAAPHGLIFGPDVATATHATLGGMIGNNSAGAHSILHGRTVEHLHAVEVLLADGTRVTLGPGGGSGGRAAELSAGVAAIVGPLAGEIRARYPTTTRRVNGYNLDLVLDQLDAGTDPRGLNLAPLICGSEGTLAVVIGATLRLVDAPRHRALGLAGFATLDDALAALAAILETKPAAVELVDDVIIGLARGNVEYRRYVELLPGAGGGGGGGCGAVMYVEYFAGDEAGLRERLAALRDAVGGAEIVEHLAPGTMAAAWKLRKAGEPLLHSVPGERKPLTFIEDLAVAPQRLPEFVRRFRDLVAGYGTTASYYAHASVGCLHMRPLIALRDPRDRAAVPAIAEAATDLVLEFGGALSGEHGDGRARSHLLRRFYGDAICDAFTRIKTLFDPEGRLNPGNIVDGPPMLADLRVEPAAGPVAVPAVKTFFRYDREHGFGPAVELCNGAGVCRKTAGGTMCPSFRALRDERHSTRGRGNALRLAITGQVGGGGGSRPAWDDADTLETLDLCLSCKACKAECPSNVDVARLKAEFLGQRHAAAGGAPWRTRVLGDVRRLHRLGSALHPLAGVLARFGPTAAIARRLLDVDPRRSLPVFGRSLYRHLRRGGASDGPAVILYPDCFTTWSEPHIGLAAVRALEALGYRVVVPRGVGCCGRGLISQGLLAEAQRTCRDSLIALEAAAAACDAAAVVACEPSCLSAIRDDWVELDLGVEPARVEGLNAMLVEQLIETRWDEHPVRPAPRVEPGRVLLHGHCHQKALWGVESSSALLARLHGDDLEVLDTGCCGLAGAFGFPPHRYDLSMAIGELTLMPAVRAAPQAIIAAPGTSCRHQIRDATGREAVHPVELAWSALSPEDSPRRAAEDRGGEFGST